MSFDHNSMINTAEMKQDQYEEVSNTNKNIIWYAGETVSHYAFLNHMQKCFKIQK